VTLVLFSLGKRFGLTKITEHGYGCISLLANYNLVFLTDDGVVFWDYAKGEETSNPRFEVPDYIPCGSVGFLLE